jgi:glycosyltransferase involved in cell wall biosynthesis
MRVLTVHNSYAQFSGEEAVVSAIDDLLCTSGHEVIRFERSSTEIPHMHLGRIRAFCSGIYSLSSRQQIQRLLEKQRPDVIHVHNVYPLISPSVLGQCRKVGIPVVMSVHNYRLVCPNGLHMPKGKFTICERCCSGREYWCLLQNCESDLFKSLGYYLRGYVSRRLRLFQDNVTMYICLTEFQKRRLMREGFPEERLTVLPNMTESRCVYAVDGSLDYVGYVGRISPEKGIECLLKSTRRLPMIPFRIAGNHDAMRQVVREAPGNVEFVGHIARKDVTKFITNSRFIILPSICFEGFPNSLAEAMMCGKPVIASRIGGIPGIVNDELTGLLFEPGDEADLTEKIKILWHNLARCRQMGQAAREKAVREYSCEKYYKRLMTVYEKAIRLGPPRLTK